MAISGVMMSMHRGTAWPGLITGIWQSSLSPFSGIGSEGYQALKMGRKFVGAELKDSYYEVACRNLAFAESEKLQGTMF